MVQDAATSNPFECSQNSLVGGGERSLYESLNVKSPFRLIGRSALLCDGETTLPQCRANKGTDLVENVLPVLPALGARPTDVMVVNFALWIHG